MIARASTNAGIESMMFVRPITRSSHHLPRKPADKPSKTPMTLLRHCVINPMAREILAPYITRERMSRPCVSVPKKKARLGALLGVEQVCLVHRIVGGEQWRTDRHQDDGQP